MATLQASHAHPVKFKGKPVYTVSEPAKSIDAKRALVNWCPDSIAQTYSGFTTSKDAAMENYRWLTTMPINKKRLFFERHICINLFGYGYPLGSK